ncbi:MAG: TolC family protein, partial [Fibrobacterota bacterium]
MFRKSVLLFTVVFFAGAEGLEEISRRMLKNNGALISQRRNLEQAEQKHIAAGALADPALSYTEYLSPVETKVGPQKRRLMLSQQFPRPGSIRLRRDIAGAQQEIAGREIRQEEAKQLRDLRMYWFSLRYTNQAENIIDSLLPLLQDLKNFVHASYETSSSGTRGLYLIEKEIITLEDERMDLQTRRKVLYRKITGLVQDTGRLTPAFADADDTFSVHGSDSAVTAEILRRNPTAGILRKKHAEKQLYTDLKKRNFAPRFSLGAAWIQTGEAPGMAESGKDPFLLTLGMRLPVYTRSKRADLSAAQKQQEGTAQTLEDYVHQLRSRTESHLLTLANKERKQELYGTRFAKLAEEIRAEQQTGYETGQASVRDIVD